MDFIDDGMLGGTDMNNNFTGTLPVFNDDDDMTFPLDPGMDTFGMGGKSFGGSYNMHMPNDFGSLGGGVGNLHGPSRSNFES